MAATVTCPRCGATSQVGYQFCTNCGGVLAGETAPPAGPPSTQAPPPPPPPFPGAYTTPPYGYQAPWEYERHKQIDRTKTGILLLLIGTLLSWIPFVNIIGFLLMFIGAILVILGRKVFGATHSRNVVVSIVIFIVGIAASLALGAIFTLSIIQGLLGQSISAEALRSAFDTLYIGGIIVTAFSGIASVLFTYALQNPTGRMLLWAGYGAAIAVDVVLYAIFSPQIEAAIQDFLASGSVDPSPLLALQNQAQVAGLLEAMPAALFSVATYIAWSRINRGEIPAAPAAAPAPPMYGQPPPPQVPPTGTPPPQTSQEQPPPIHPK